MPGRRLVWRTASYDRARELLTVAEDAQANGDRVALIAAIERLRALPGFPRDMAPTDTLHVEKIPPIISVGTV